MFGHLKTGLDRIFTYKRSIDHTDRENCTEIRKSMKKFICLLAIFSFKAIQCMDSNGNKLRYDEITLTNKSPIPLELSWMERDLRKGSPTTLTRLVKPGETIKVKLGEIGGVSTSAKIIYRPIVSNQDFTQEWAINLANTNAFAFTAVKMADIMNDIWVPGILKADDKGNFGSFQYMNVYDTNKWQQIIGAAGEIKVIKK